MVNGKWKSSNQANIRKNPPFTVIFSNFLFKIEKYVADLFENAMTWGEDGLT